MNTSFHRTGNPLRRELFASIAPLGLACGSGSALVLIRDHKIVVE